MPAISAELSATRPITETTNYSYLSIPFFKSTVQKKLPLFQSPCSSELGRKLLQRELNPCICYKIANFDLGSYQWLFNIFVEVISLKINLQDTQNTEFLPQLRKIIEDFNKNRSDSEKAEIAFEATHKQVYRENFEVPNVLIPWVHTRNVKEKTFLEDKFPKLINKLMTLYSELIMQKNSNLANEHDNFARKDFLDRLEGKPFS